MSSIKHNCIKKEEFINNVKAIKDRINSVGLNDSLKSVLPICLTDVNNSLVILEGAFLLGLTKEGAMSIILTMYLEKGYKAGMEAAEAKLKEVDKKLEDIR